MQWTKPSSLQARNFQPHGIGADVDRGKGGHGRLTVYMQKGSPSPEFNGQIFTTKDTKYHEGFAIEVFPSCNFMTFVVMIFITACGVL
jgi:hypothetical protein